MQKFKLQKTIDILKNKSFLGSLNADNAVKKDPLEKFNLLKVEEGREERVMFTPGDRYVPEDLMKLKPKETYVRKDLFRKNKFDLRTCYKNANFLCHFIGEKGRIKSKRETGLSAKSQRGVTKAIKRARQIGILSSVSRHGFKEEFIKGDLF